jgi:hypothetical protein
MEEELFRTVLPEHMENGKDSRVSEDFLHYGYEHDYEPGMYDKEDGQANIGGTYATWGKKPGDIEYITPGQARDYPMEESELNKVDKFRNVDKWSAYSV